MCILFVASQHPFWVVRADSDCVGSGDQRVAQGSAGECTCAFSDSHACARCYIRFLNCASCLHIDTKTERRLTRDIR